MATNDVTAVNFLTTTEAKKSVDTSSENSTQVETTVPVGQKNINEVRTGVSRVLNSEDLTAELSGKKTVTENDYNSRLYSVDGYSENKDDASIKSMVANAFAKVKDLFSTTKKDTKSVTETEKSDKKPLAEEELAKSRLEKDSERSKDYSKIKELNEKVKSGQKLSTSELQELQNIQDAAYTRKAESDGIKESHGATGLSEEELNQAISFMTTSCKPEDLPKAQYKDSEAFKQLPANVQTYINGLQAMAGSGQLSN